MPLRDSTAEDKLILNLQWFGQMSPWCKLKLWEMMAFKVLWGDLAKRLLGAKAESAPRSLLARSPHIVCFLDW